MKMKLTANGITIETRTVIVKNDQAAISRRIKWYEARGWICADLVKLPLDASRAQILFTRRTVKERDVMAKPTEGMRGGGEN